MVVTVLT